MRTRDIVAAIDFDEVIYGWYERAHNACELAGVTGDFPGIPMTWFPYEEYGISQQRWHEVITQAADDGYLYTAAPIEGAVEALHLLREHGVTNYIVTARGNGQLPRGPEIRRWTYEYIETWELPVDGIFFTRDKEEVARSIKATHAVDDHLRNYEAFERAGAITYLVEQPWNIDAPDSVRRVKNLGEFAEQILVKV